MNVRLKCDDCAREWDAYGNADQVDLALDVHRQWFNHQNVYVLHDLTRSYKVVCRGERSYLLNLARVLNGKAAARQAPQAWRVVPSGS